MNTPEQIKKMVLAVSEEINSMTARRLKKLARRRQENANEIHEQGGSNESYVAEQALAMTLKAMSDVMEDMAGREGNESPVPGLTLDFTGRTDLREDFLDAFQRAREVLEVILGKNSQDYVEIPLSVLSVVRGALSQMDDVVERSSYFDHASAPGGDAATPSGEPPRMQDRVDFCASILHGYALRGAVYDDYVMARLRDRTPFPDETGDDAAARVDFWTSVQPAAVHSDDLPSGTDRKVELLRDTLQQILALHELPESDVNLGETHVGGIRATLKSTE